MKRIMRVYAEIFDDVTGLISTASLGENSEWPPGLEEQVEGARRSSLGVPGEAVGDDQAEEDRTTVDLGAAEAEASEESRQEQADDEPRVPPTYMSEMTDPEGEPVVSADKLPDFEVIDDPAALTLIWDDGVTEKNRRMHMAPFSDGMWVIFENSGEFLVFVKRGHSEATEFEAQSSLKEAKALASMVSKRWMSETQGDPFLQKLAATNAQAIVQWVGMWLFTDGEKFHFRRGRVRRQQTTTIVTYVAPKTEDGRARIEIRLTPTSTGETLAVWALQYAPDGKLIGSFSEADFPRTRLPEIRELTFGPAPGKRLTWTATAPGEEQARWGRHVLVIQHGRGVSGLVIRKRGRNTMLACGPTDELKGRALNLLTGHLRTRPRKSSSKASEPELVPKPEPGRTTASRKPVPKAKPVPKSETISEPKPEPAPEPVTLQPLSPAMYDALRALSSTPAKQVRAWDRIHAKTRAGLVTRGLATEGGQLTELGRAVLKQSMSRDDQAEDEDEVEIEAEEEGVAADVTPEQARAIEDTLSHAVSEVTDRLPPLPAE